MREYTTLSFLIIGIETKAHIMRERRFQPRIPFTDVQWIGIVSDR